MKKPSTPYRDVPLKVTALKLNKAKIPANNEKGVMQKAYAQNSFLNANGLLFKA